MRISFEIPQFTVQANALGTLNMLESMRNFAPKARLLPGVLVRDVRQQCRSRWQAARDDADDAGQSLRLRQAVCLSHRQELPAFLQAVRRNGILFNHESPRRASNFVTSKIVKNAVLISMGKLAKLELGNLDSQRDWGHSKDYVRAMHLILQHNEPDDFVIATGETHSVREFCEIVFNKLGLDYRQYVVQSPRFVRPEELHYLCGDCTKAKTTLGWKPDYSFEQLIDEMIEAFQQSLGAGAEEVRAGGRR